MLGLHRLLRRWRVRKGRLVVLPSVPSPELDNRRDLYIYVPAAAARGHSRYPVIYMQDGQNLFDPGQSVAGTWGVDETLSWASRRGLDAIVVGIPNMGDARIAEYDPFMGTGDRYLNFVTHTVKPIVDAQFPTLPDRRHTGIAGSSMGGLISLYAFFRYSESSSRSCCRTGRREARVPQVAQPCAGARHGAPGAGTCGRAGPGVPHVAGQLFRVDRPPDGSTGRAGRAPRERLDPDVLSPPRARGELVRRAPAPGGPSLAAPPVRSLPAGRGDPVQRRPEPEPICDRGGRALRGLPR